MSDGERNVPSPEQLEAELKETRLNLHEKVTEILNYADEFAFFGPSVDRRHLELTDLMIGSHFNHAFCMVKDALRTRMLLDHLRQEP